MQILKGNKTYSVAKSSGTFYNFLGNLYFPRVESIIILGKESFNQIRTHFKQELVTHTIVGCLNYGEE